MRDDKKDEVPQFVFVPTSVISVRYEFALHSDILNILKENEDYFLGEIINDDMIWEANLCTYGITVDIHYLVLNQMKDVIDWINKIIHKTVKDQFGIRMLVREDKDKSEYKEYLKKLENK